MKRILALFVVLVFVGFGSGCGGGDEYQLDFTPDELLEPDEFLPSDDFDPSDYGNRLADADYIPDEIVSLFVDSFSSNSAKARIIKRLRDNVPCFRALSNDTDEEIWERVVYRFDLENIEDWGNTLEEAVRNTLANRLHVEPDDTPEHIWGNMVDAIDGC